MFMLDALKVDTQDSILITLCTVEIQWTGPLITFYLMYTFADAFYGLAMAPCQNRYVIFIHTWKASLNNSLNHYGVNNLCNKKVFLSLCQEF